MNLPTPPTDNLYKFVALAGLALLIFSIVYPLKLIDDLELRLVDTEMRRDMLLVDISALERAADRLTATRVQNPAVTEQWTEIRKTLEKTHIENRSEEERFKILLKQIRGKLIWLAVGTGVGYILAHRGFYLWYHRVQKPLDELARNRNEKKDA